MTSLPNCIEVDGAKLTNTQDIADAFNSHFSTIAKNLPAQNQPFQTSSTTFFSLLVLTITIHFFLTLSLPRNQTHNLYYMSKCSSECNSIPSKLLHELPEPTWEVLAHIFNQSFNTGKFSSTFY